MLAQPYELVWVHISLRSSNVINNLQTSRAVVIAPLSSGIFKCRPGGRVGVKFGRKFGTSGVIITIFLLELSCTLCSDPGSSSCCSSCCSSPSPSSTSSPSSYHSFALFIFRGKFWWWVLGFIIPHILTLKCTKNKQNILCQSDK